MLALFLLLALLLVLVGHAFRLLRWEQFIRIYERPPRGQMLRGMAGGYALNFVLPFHLGDAFRAVYTGRRMKSGIGFALATVIMDRFLDVWFVAFGFIAFRLLGLGGAPVDGAARYYLVFSLLLVLGLVLVVALRDFLKKICLAFCGLFNDTLKLDGMMFFWSLINTFKDLGRVKIGRLVVNTLLMWAAYLGSYTALAAALTVAGEPMQLVDVFGLLFGRNAADFAALLPGGALGTAAPAARWLLLAWFVLPLLAMWAATLLPEGVRGAMNQATQAAPAGESYLNLLPQADEHDRAVFLSRYFGLENKDYVKRFLQMNRGITILEDYSAGSNATTMLCMDTQSTFYRKYAFGKDGAKLAEQLDWLRARQDRLPLCDILRSEEADGCCWYDMVYSPQAVGIRLLGQQLGTAQQDLAVLIGLEAVLGVLAAVLLAEKAGKTTGLVVEQGAGVAQLVTDRGLQRGAQHLGLRAGQRAVIAADRQRYAHHHAGGDQQQDRQRAQQLHHGQAGFLLLFHGQVPPVPAMRGGRSIAVVGVVAVAVLCGVFLHGDGEGAGAASGGHGEAGRLRGAVVAHRHVRVPHLGVDAGGRHDRCGQKGHHQYHDQQGYQCLYQCFTPAGAQLFHEPASFRWMVPPSVHEMVSTVVVIL